MIKALLGWKRRGLIIMLDYLIAWGTIYMPVGVVFALLSLDREGIESLGFFICGIGFIILGLFSMQKAWSRARDKEGEEEERFKKIIEAIDRLGLIIYKHWADITRHEPSKRIVIEHKPRSSIRLEPTQIGRTRKRVRILDKARVRL